MRDMHDRNVLITGATSGIGRATAHALAGMGARILLVARNEAKGRATIDQIRSATGNDRLDLLLADLSSQASIRRLATEVASRYDRLDVLVNNAGEYFGRRLATVDGLEMTFALNHLAYFLLTNLLLDLLKAGAPSRIVSLSSGAHRVGHINFDDLQGEKGNSGMRAYSQSKLANLLFTYELARRLEGTGVTANALQPGSVRTNFGRGEGSGWMGRVVRITAPFMRSPEKGAETVVWLASSPEVERVSGGFFGDRKQVRSSPESYDRDVAARLWKVSEGLTGLSASEGR